MVKFWGQRSSASGSEVSWWPTQG